MFKIFSSKPPTPQGKTGIRPFTDVLRKQGGWILEYDSAAGGMRCRTYSKVIGERKIDIQFWSDGNHRVSHWIGITPHGGRMCTLPTDFEDIEGMLRAIDIELTRTDHPTR